jgi:ion channel-forming bestrophin family protein
VKSYNPKAWFSLIFQIHKADTFRKLLPLMLAIALYAGVVGYLELAYWKLSSSSYVRNLTLLHSMLAFVISLLLVFRTNTAYDRWWEGRKQWGALTNVSRNLALRLAALLEDPAERKVFQELIPAYAHTLVAHLQEERTRTLLFEEVRLDPAIGRHLPNQVAGILMGRIQRLYGQGVLDGYQLLSLNEELRAFTDICGACERIKNTPIPYSYTAFIKKFLFIYVMTLPFGFVFDLGYFVIPVVVFIFYVLMSLELIAEEIEDPFGSDANDLPLQRIAENIGQHVREIFEEGVRAPEPEVKAG